MPFIQSSTLTPECEAALASTLGPRSLVPELLSALLTARPGPQQPDLVLDTETGDQKVEEEEEWRLDQD